VFQLFQAEFQDDVVRGQISAEPCPTLCVWGRPGKMDVATGVGVPGIFSRSRHLVSLLRYCGKWADTNSMAVAGGM
jgi:hypothetical protein